MRSWAYNSFGVLMGTSWRASCLRWPSWMGDSWPMITLFLSQGDFCATAEGEIRTASFENSEHAYDHVQGGFDKEAHQHVRANAERLQMVGEVIRPLI